MKKDSVVYSDELVAEACRACYREFFMDREAAMCPGEDRELECPRVLEALGWD